jgi:predicted nucleic acid-binding protein
MPTKILVSDTNIWIDLHRSGLLEVVFKLPHQFVTTDFVWLELHKPPGRQLNELGLVIESMSSEEVGELYELRHSLNNSSLADVSCYFVAKERGWTLLTNDGHLRRTGLRANLEVRGVLWILDELERCRLLTQPELASALESMLEKGARLPDADCRQRLKRWKND